MTERQIVLVRHAKAVEPGSVEDHERPLTERGTADAQEIGRGLKERGLKPDFAWCSTAMRTRQTWASAVETLRTGGLVDHDHRIYDAAPGTLVDVLRETPDDVSTVVLIGHAPGVPGVAAALTEGSGAGVDFQAHFRTAGVAVLGTDIAWADLAPGVCDLVDHFVARASK